MAKLKKVERQNLLKEKLNNTPFITDEELAELFKVSVPTIRLDRLELKIPELRERIKEMARENVQDITTFNKNQNGEVLDLTIGNQGISLLNTTKEMTDENGFVESQYLYAQANHLARLVVGDALDVSGVGNIKYKNPVLANKKLIAKAEVIRKRENKAFVWVIIKDKDKEVFRAKFIMQIDNKQ